MISPQTSKLYACQRCGHEQRQTTNHYGVTWSCGRVSACPICPPWAKYPEYGGQTVWICKDSPPKPILWLEHNGDPYGTGFTASESKDNGESWFYRGDIGAMPRAWWRTHARIHGYTLREVETAVRPSRRKRGGLGLLLLLSLCFAGCEHYGGPEPYTGLCVYSEAPPPPWHPRTGCR